ncbi:MAG: hypothetical protein UT05_C0006G0018 [Parcubacteria group bacterium GW2011_GWF2_38_76]|nr:MAG: hypothetical protein UT05_C0006G0018 [Parcubacteria group bacterium GW2011_GWF2_38_76]HBM45882.1 hypothetical protein [Patescibacteria group bacterium]
MRDKIRANLKISIISLIILAIISYAYFETSEVLRGPIVEINSPKSGFSSKENTVEITGKVRNISYMYLNGRPIFADTAGNLKEKVILAEGYNSIFIEARDRIGKKKTQTIEIVFNKDKSDEAPAESLAREAINPSKI